VRTGAAAGHQGYFHEAFYYASNDELLDVVVPFLAGGLAAGEPTIVALGEKNATLVREALPPDAPIEYLTGDAVYARPAGAIRSYRDLLADCSAGGVGQIRIIGEMPTEAMGDRWDWWARYEAAINYAYDEWPLWSMCAYDTRTTPPHVLDDVARTHPRVATPDGRHPRSPEYVAPERYLMASRPVLPDPLEHGPAVVDLADPSPGVARRAVEAAVSGTLTPESTSDLLIAVSEAVSNVWRHGKAPSRLRAWAGGGRAIVQVGDGGGGPTDPYAGLLPARAVTSGGLGLWLIHQLCDHVTFDRSDGFTIRLVAG
jgi:anti-sigma regulatory factor (Ser/Thr protein kinase)